MLAQEIPNRTALYEAHVKWGGRMVDFAGWEMPVQYTSIIEEHRAVRSAAGLFDISHMGEFLVRGKNSAAWLNGILTNDTAKLQSDTGQYTLMLNEDGGVIDDLIIYQLGEDEFFLVVNAGKIEEDFEWLRARLKDGIELQNQSNEMAALALQGPNSEKILQKIFGAKLAAPQRNQIIRHSWQGEEILIARTGYTGEDGFEFFFPAGTASELWELVLQKGKSHGCQPIGLGARDTLRLEACLPLNGNDLSPAITPLEAGLAKFVSFEKPDDFPGRAELEKSEPRRKSIAFSLEKPGAPPRAHYPVFAHNKKIGEVTSGTLSPTLQKGIGLALIDKIFAEVGSEIDIEIRGNRASAIIQSKPLYKREKKEKNKP